MKNKDEEKEETDSLEEEIDWEESDTSSRSNVWAISTIV